MWNLALAPLLLISAIQAAPPKGLDWTWDRTTPACTLQQSVSSDGKIISVSRTPGNDSTSLRVGPTVPLVDRFETFRDGKINFAPGVTSEGTIFLIASSGKRDIFVASDDPEFLSKLARASALELVQDKFGMQRIPLRSAAAAADALRKCEDSRMRDWGMDPVAWRALKVRPQPVKNAPPWFTGDDYPVSAIWEGLQGFSISRVEVAPDGRVGSCVSLNRNRAPNVKDRMCIKLKHRARFTPALDANGRPVAAPYVVLVKFQLASW
jgi:hypothetical protein